MTGLLDWLKSLYTVGVQYICWLGLATLVFSHSLEKRKMACLKGSAATAGFLLLGMLASSTAVDGALPVVWYFVLPLVNMLVIMSYCQISWREAFQCALLASLTEHLANSVYILIFVSNEFGVLHHQLTGVCMHLVFLGQKNGTHRALLCDKLGHCSDDAAVPDGAGVSEL